MKSITPVVSVILMVLITIVASVSAFFFINSSVNDLQSQGNVDTYPGNDNSRLNLVSITGSKAIVRNDGTAPVTEVVMFVNGELFNYTLDTPILPGELKEINYTAQVIGQDLEIKIIYNTGKTVSKTSPAKLNTVLGGFIITNSINTFNDGSFFKNIIFSQAGTNNSIKIILPKNATILNTRLNIKGNQTLTIWDKTWATGNGLSNSGSNCFWPDIVIGSDDSIHIVWSDGSNIKYAFKETGEEWNTTFTEGTGLGPTSGPQVELDSNDNPHFVWYNSESISYAYFNRTTEYFNMTLATGNGISDPGTDNGDYDPGIGIDSEDNIHVDYLSSYLGAFYHMDTMYIFYNETLESWQSKEYLGLCNWASYTKITIDSNDNPHITWTCGFDASGDEYIYHKYKNIATGSWSSSYKVSTGHYAAYGASIDSDSQGNIHMVYKDGGIEADTETYYAIRFANGTWDNSLTLLGGLSNNTGSSRSTDIIVDSNDNIHVVWEDNSDGDYEIYYAVKNATTGIWDKTWATGGGITDDALNPSSINPRIEVDSQGKIHVAWKNTDIYYAIGGEFYPNSPSLDVGSDIDSQWNYSGDFSSSETISDFSTELNNILSSCNCSGCTEEGDDCIIDLNMSSSSAGIIQLSELEISYSQ
jgi:flagellin-like protein